MTPSGSIAVTILNGISPKTLNKIQVDITARGLLSDFYQ